MAIVVRPVGEDERAAWEPLWEAYLAFYETALPASVIDTTWSRLNDPNEPMFLLGAYVDGGLVGIAQYLFHRTHWSVSDNCYLQDLFVDASARGKGVGRALIATVEAKAREAGAARLYWTTKEDNHTARRLYDQVAELSGFIQYRKAL